jgi:hypothetical protein
MAQNWPTPDVCSASRDMSNIDPERQKTANGKVTIGLPTIAENWPTPAARDDQKSPEAYRHMREHKLGRTGAAAETISSLSVKVQTWPTPASRDYRSEEGGVATMDHFNRPAGPSLPAFIRYSPQAQAIHDGQKSSEKDPTSPRLRLNPNFVDWLMGWPAGMTSTEPTACGAAEMELFRSKQQQALLSFFAEQD